MYLLFGFTCLHMENTFKKKIKRTNQSNRRQENTGYIFSRFLESTSKDISVENSAKKNFQPSCRTGISIS